MLEAKEVKQILAAVKAAGVELEDKDVEKGLGAALGELTLSTSESIPDGHETIESSKLSEMRKDLTKLRGRMHTAETRADEAENDLKRGNVALAEKNERLQTQITELTPIVEEYDKAALTRWKEVASGNVPDSLKHRYTFAKEGDDAEPLEAADIRANLIKYDEHVADGVITLSGGKDADGKPTPITPPKGPPGGGDNRGQDKKPLGTDAAKVMSTGYKPMPGAAETK